MRMGVLRKFVIGCFNTLVLFPALVLAELQIEHVPTGVVSAGERPSLAARVVDEDGDVELVRAYFKSLSGSDYLYVPMSKGADAADRYVALLPAPSPDTQSIDYFLLAKSAAGAVVKSQNFTLDVTPGERTPPAITEPDRFASVDDFHGRLVRFTGNVEIVNLYGQSRAPAEVGFVVRRSETVRTGDSGVVVLDFDNDPITVLDNNSELRVRTPTWFSHLAGKAYFAFQRLLGVTQQPRSVNNTVALIGIRGTTFISYDGALKGVALKEGSLQVSRSRPRPMSLSRDGVTQTTNRFTLGPERLALFDGASVTESGFTPEVLADFARLEAFAAAALGLPQTAEQAPVDQSPIDVYSEAPSVPTQAAGFTDTINLLPTPADAVLGISSTTATAVAGTGTTTSALAASPWIITAVGVGAAVAISNADDSGGGGAGSGDSSDDAALPGNFVAEVTVSCNSCPIAFLDTNQVQDDFYDLYVNDTLVGPVNNTPGGIVRHTATFVSGSNTMELRFTAVQCCNTDLQADFNNGEAITPFSGSANHTWTVNAP